MFKKNKKNKLKENVPDSAFREANLEEVNSEESILEEFLIKKGEREWKKSIGKYNIFFPLEKDLIEIYSRHYATAKPREKDSTTKEIVVDNVDLFIDLFRVMTDLPDKIYNTKSMRELIAGSKKNFFQKIMDEVFGMWTDFVLNNTEMLGKLSRMTDAFPKGKEGLVKKGKQIQKANKEKYEKRQELKAEEEKAKKAQNRIDKIKSYKEMGYTADEIIVLMDLETMTDVGEGGE